MERSKLSSQWAYTLSQKHKEVTSTFQTSLIILHFYTSTSVFREDDKSNAQSLSLLLPMLVPHQSSILSTLLIFCLLKDSMVAQRAGTECLALLPPHTSEGMWPKSNPPPKSGVSNRLLFCCQLNHMEGGEKWPHGESYLLKAKILNTIVYKYLRVINALISSLSLFIISITTATLWHIQDCYYYYHYRQRRRLTDFYELNL